MNSIESALGKIKVRYLFLQCFVLMFGVVLVYRFIGRESGDQVSTLILSYVLLTYILVWTCFYLWSSNISFRALFVYSGQCGRTRIEIGTIVMIILMYQLMVFGWQGTTSLFNEGEFTSDSSELQEYLKPYYLIHLLLMVPIAEEVLFTGIILHRLAIKWGNITSILVTSICFGLLHGNNFIPTFVLSIIATGVYMRSGSFLYPIIIHIINNIVSIVIIYIQAKIPFHFTVTEVYILIGFFIFPSIWMYRLFSSIRHEYNNRMPLFQKEM